MTPPEPPAAAREAADAMNEIKETEPWADLELRELDLADLASVRSFAAGFLRDHATLVHRPPFVIERREVDPAEVRPEAGAPDDVCDVENAAAR